MNRLLNQGWWLVNLGVLTLIAFLSAKVANHLLAGEIIAAPTKPKAVEVKPPKVTSSKQQAEWAASISNRNLFNANPPEEVEGGGEGDGEGEAKPAGAIPGPYDECEAAKVGLSLMATMVMEPAEESLAVLDAGQKGEHLVKTLAELEDGVTVAAIYRERAVLLKGGRYSCLQLGERAAGAGRRKGGGKASAWKPGKSDGGKKPRSKVTKAESDRIKAGIKQEGNRTIVDKGMLDEQLEQLDRLAQQARVTPYYKNGKQQGFKVARVKRNSLYQHLGLKRGDVLKGVNGEALTSPNKALSLLDQLGTARDVKIEIERRGKPTTLEFNIR